MKSHGRISHSDPSEADLIDVPVRHHCYEPQIATSHFGWNVWTGNNQELAAVAAGAELLLERGPLRNVAH